MAQISHLLRHRAISSFYPTQEKRCLILCTALYLPRCPPDGLLCKDCRYICLSSQGATVWWTGSTPAPYPLWYTFCTECNLSGESTPTGLHRPWCPAHTYYVLPSGFPCSTFSQLITRDVCGSAICHLPKSSTVQPSKHSSCTVLGQSLRGHFLVGFLDMPSAFLWWFIFLCTMV